MNKKYPRVLVAIDTVFGKEKEIKDLSTDELLDLFEKILQRKDVKWVDAKIYFKNGRQLGFDESKRGQYDYVRKILSIAGYDMNKINKIKRVTIETIGANTSVELDGVILIMFHLVGDH